VFAPGCRPTANDLRLFSAATGQFSLSLDPAPGAPDEPTWVELLANGLTFDCTGLSHGPAEPLPDRAHSFGLAPAVDFSAAETVTVVPGPHLSVGAAMFPVVRALAWLGAMLAGMPGVEAVVWHGANSYNAPEHFRTGVLRWIAGGVFPGLGLTALVRTTDHGLASEGLALFAGQEIVLAPELALDRAEGAKLALRLMHWLVENGGIAGASGLTGPSGEPLLLEPQPNQHIIKVSRGL